MDKNSDLRDSTEYIQKQVWGEWIFTRQHSRRFDLVEIRQSTMILRTPHRKRVDVETNTAWKDLMYF